MAFPPIPTTITVRYVSGAEVTASPEAWPTVAADGVDRVVVNFADGTSSRWQGRSLYWLYREVDHWVIGMASFTYSSRQPPEVLFWSDGRQELREWEHVPDLLHRDVKLGWWWLR
jgi:hypothetical protein